MLFSELKRNLTADYTGLPVRRLALLGDSATQFLAKAIKGYGYCEKLNFEIFDADYDQIDHQVFDPSSDLYRSAAEYIVLTVCSEKLWERYSAIAQDRRASF